MGQKFLILIPPAVSVHSLISMGVLYAWITDFAHHGYILQTAFLFSLPLGTIHHFSLTDQVQSYTEDTTKTYLSRRLWLDVPGHKLQGPPESCLGPSVTIYLLPCCTTTYHFILVNRSTFYQHFSKKKSYGPQAEKRQKIPDTKASEIKIRETDIYMFVYLGPWDY